MSNDNTTKDLIDEVRNEIEKRSIPKERIQRIIDITQKYKDTNKNNKKNIHWVLLNTRASSY